MVISQYTGSGFDDGAVILYTPFLPLVFGYFSKMSKQSKPASFLKPCTFRRDWLITSTFLNILKASAEENCSTMWKLVLLIFSRMCLLFALFISQTSVTFSISSRNSFRKFVSILSKLSPIFAVHSDTAWLALRTIESIKLDVTTCSFCNWSDSPTNASFKVFFS